MKSTDIFAKIGAATIALLMAMSIIGCPQTNNGNDHNGDIVNEVTVITRDGVTFTIPAGLRQGQVDAISAIVNALDVTGFSGYVTNVSFASVGNRIIQLVGTGADTMATITLPLNATAEQIAEAFADAQGYVSVARQADENGNGDNGDNGTDATFVEEIFGIRFYIEKGFDFDEEQFKASIRDTGLLADHDYSPWVLSFTLTETGGFNFELNDDLSAVIKSDSYDSASLRAQLDEAMMYAWDAQEAAQARRRNGGGARVSVMKTP